MDNPQSLLDALEKTLSDWQKLGRRAQLEAVMPMLEILAKRKVGYATLANLLRGQGLDIKPDSLRQALHRWRKKQGFFPAEDIGVHPTRTASHGATDQAGTVAAIPMLANPPAATNFAIETPRPTLTKARFREIRDQHIDLEAIIKASRKIDGPK
ncbi:hypothetical protein [Pollutimonas bauzanensis]|uniref:Uncharacterized protein n=1 Tax=Pollutimonas bauzanensis TaxID=658167 RepID=A0A1M5YIR5_9BURK|nr:hypothetical protein [Pollutimonas bauzanensis]SHI11917.1 hypothetical protein SAMN04488135_109134 [Pollutimonas bauzanensis]